jgi:Ig-like domain from next to BRCA1 gene
MLLARLPASWPNRLVWRLPIANPGMKKSAAWIFVSLALAGLAGCNMPRGQDASATPNATQIFQTVLARLTQTQSNAPTFTASPAPVASQSPTATTQLAAVATQAPEAPSQTSNPAQTCDWAAPGVPIDVTIPDDTVLQPGQSFTKIWRLRNVGTCTWTQAYRVELFSGDAMGAASSLPLAQEVLPGQGIDISVDMIAPRAAGMFQGNWKLRNQKNQWFGIGPNGDSPFWVRVVIPPTPTPSPTITPEVTPTPTLTPIPTFAPQAAGTITVTLGTKIDLDNGDLNPVSGADLTYEANSKRQHLLTPTDKAVLGVFGTESPNQEDCRSEAMGSVEYVIEDLTDGTYLCYHTDQGLPGWMKIVQLDSTSDVLQLQYFTWAQP